MILRESLILGFLGGLVGILFGLGLGQLIGFLPGLYGGLPMTYEPALFAQALAVALLAGAVGGLYPAWRATRLQPVEALRYE
jgi:putative ABC transport system permease protein